MTLPPDEERPQLLDLNALINRQGLELRVSDPAKIEAEREEDRHRRKLEVLRFWFFAPSLLALTLFLSWVVASCPTTDTVRAPALSGILMIVSASAGFVSGRATTR
ncbi:MAG TPA: hypothetical protein VHO06_19600 [Polyangia bacterium]|nr:hypothetical protein [Polyangia bacterium]